MHDQPDFTALFREWGGSQPRLRRYVTRSVPHLIHDCVFLSSLIHDARIQSASIDSDRLELRIERDTWECFHVTGELSSLKSLLTVSGVRNVQIDPKIPLIELPSLGPVDGLAFDDLQARQSGEWIFHLLGEGWRLSCVTDEFVGRIELVDLRLQ